MFRVILPYLTPELKVKFIEDSRFMLLPDGIDSIGSQYFAGITPWLPYTKDSECDCSPPKFKHEYGLWGGHLIHDKDWVICTSPYMMNNIPSYPSPIIRSNTFVQAKMEILDFPRPTMDNIYEM